MRTVYKNFLWLDTDRGYMLSTDENRVLEIGETVSAEGAEIIDKSGYRLFPPFVDNHLHILPTGLDLLKLNLLATGSHEEVLDSLRESHRSSPDGWLLAVHYDQNRYGGVHLTRGDLDKISSDRPILLRHSSGHAGVANSAALESAQIAPDVKDEQGGEFVRDAAGSLTGVLLENAFEKVSRAIPKPTHEVMVGAILTATDSMAERNIACASDMQTGWLDLAAELAAYREAAQRGAKTNMRLYLQWGRVFGPRAPAKAEFDELVRSFEGSCCRVQGIKLFADGAIGAETAAIYGSYATNPSSTPTTGTLMYKPELLKSRIKLAASEGWQVAVHAIGDYATDLVLDAFQETATPSSHRLEHAMILSDLQIERLAAVGCHVSIQPEFLERFGDMYRTKLGERRAANLIRTRSLLDAGIRVSMSSDRPITSGLPSVAIQTACDRPLGFDPHENCTRIEGFIAHTVVAADVSGDRERIADLVNRDQRSLNWVQI